MALQLNFTGPFHSYVSFDKNEVRRKIEIPTYNQARRLTNIYKALIKEFREEGCLTSAKCFKFLIEKERKLYESAVIRDRISDEPQLLLGLFDNCKVAEKAALLGQCNGPVVCSRLLLQCILLLEPHESKFNWIFMDVFKIITKVCSKVCKDINISKESLCQIYYKFGLYLIKVDLEKAVTYLEKSFELAKGTIWENPEQGIKKKSSHYSSIIANRFAGALLNYGNQILRDSPDKAINMAQKAVAVIMAGGIESNKIMYINAYLNMAEFQIEASNFEVSLKTLKYISKYIRSNANEDSEYLKFSSRYNHLKGVCFERLKRYDLAFRELQESLKIARKLNMKQSEGEILIDIAKVYMACGRSQFSMAKSHFQKSKEIFIQINDTFNIKKTSYLMANLKAQNIQPLILDSIKNSSFVYCDKHRLRHWKYMCLPFWRDIHRTLEEEARDPLQCLMLPPTQMKQKQQTKTSHIQ